MSGQMAYREKPSIPRLTPYVECVWTHGPSCEPTRVLPDTCIDLVFSRATGLQFVGSMTRALRVEPCAAMVLGIRLRAGAVCSLLGIPVREMSDQVISFAALSGKFGRALEESLQNATSADTALCLLQSALQPLRPLSPVQCAIAHLANNAGYVRLDETAQRANLSIRQFRRHCIEETGLSPKHLARIGRFRRVCSLITASRFHAWADLAAESGYYDQAHLIHDFTEFSGLTPAAYELARRPAA